MKVLIPILIGLLVVGCATIPVKELTLEEKVVGTYEAKKGEDTARLVLLENGIADGYKISEKEKEGYKWSTIKAGEIHLKKVDGDIVVLRINRDDSLTFISVIFTNEGIRAKLQDEGDPKILIFNKDGLRREVPKKGQVTFKKIK